MRNTRTVNTMEYVISDKDREMPEPVKERAKVIEAGFREIKKETKEHDYEDKTVSAITALDKGKDLTACVYKGEPFLGVRDRETRQITLERKEINLEKIRTEELERLVHELKASQVHLEETGELDARSKELAPEWEPLHPTMDKIVEYEKEVERLPESKQHILQKSGLYEQKIDDMISAGEKEMHPLTEQALEEYYGVDIGKSGKRNIEGPMSTLEQDIMEKTYHKDFESEGFVDEEWHVEEHVEPIQSVPLRERFERAKEEAREINASKGTESREKSIEINTEEFELKKAGF